MKTDGRSGDSRFQSIALWSAPRSRSTAFSRMVVERHDFLVIHEPFSHVADFGESTVGDRFAHSEREVIAALRELGAKTNIFFKDTTDFHYPELLRDQRFLREVTHTFLIRHPRAAIASHYALNPDLRRDDIGFARLHEIYCAVREATGQGPVVIDSDELVTRPEATIRAYCDHVAISYLPQALSWSPCLREEWRRTARWHVDVSKSGGFEHRDGLYAIDVEGHPVLGGHYRYHLPYYELLHAQCLRP